ncbi:MAG: proprotein convertase P-domain-containing protein [Saprospiraceae bacterium]|nr:proprotein convertase P-domain-containing protein [Saprospiraceae bacterium]
MFKNFLLLLCLFLFAGALGAQSLWQEATENTTSVSGERRIVPKKYKTMQLNMQALKPVLNAAALQIQGGAYPDQSPLLSVPTPDGGIAQFRIVEKPVMAPELQAKFPEIRCYTGYGIDDPTARIKMDVTPWGFHGMVQSAVGNTYYIDPMIHGNAEYYVVYYKKDFAGDQDTENWTCAQGTPDGAAELIQVKPELTQSESVAFQGDTKLRTYRLALACTGEYSSFHGGTKPLVLAAMNTTMNRVNGVYETDFGATMQIIANNDLLIYLSAGSDPFTNNDGGAMLAQNQTTCDNIVGNGNYDIGHVFSTGGGGVAFLGVVCNNTFKARGVTGLGAPVGDPFDIDYVAHEMGHQFGGSHTFNGTQGSCGGNASIRVEPGSGTTIMAYAGICGAQDVAAHSEDIFHGYSIAEMGAFIYTGGGNTCPVKTSTTNNNPNVSAGSDYTIPKSTPFALTAVGSDIDGDMLTYTWEQIDNAAATSPPVATSTAGALFRSFKGTTSPTRVFPRMVDIVNNVNPTWEKLPSVARNMNFRVVARDHNAQAGCTDEDDVKVTVSGAAGPFLVSVPNTNITWNVGDTKTVTWDVANTTASPVSCANVKISLSTDGGFTYPIVLLNSTTNDGSADIVVPNKVSTTCRVKVEAVNNIFFDISNANFRIDPPMFPTFFLTASQTQVTACAGTSASFDLALEQVLGFSTAAQITLTGAPGAAIVTITPNPATQDGTATVNISNLTSGMAGTYNLDIQAVAGAITRNVSVELTVLSGPGSPSSLSPADGTTGVSSNTTLGWNIQFSDTYQVEVATDPSFSPGSIVSSQLVSTSSTSLTGLSSGTVYYWRVKGINQCGEGTFSTASAFQVGNSSCNNNYSSTDVPKAITSSSIVTVISTLNVPDNRVLEDVNVGLQINHTWVGDLDAKLISPSNDTVVLFDRPGVPADDFGCNGSNAIVSFDSETAQSATLLENQCNNAPPALIGAFQSIQSLTKMNGKSAQGDWKLVVTDSYNEDGGNITAWNISLCFADVIPAGALLANNPLNVEYGGSGTITTSLLLLDLSGTTSQGQYVLLSLPAHGTLNLNGTPLVIGDSFTQADIDAGLVTYTNNGDPDATDQFVFDAIDNNNDHWVHNTTFHINVVENNLSATASETLPVLCHDGNDGQITVTATGLDGNYQYSLNGGAQQASNVFDGLTAGDYTVVVTGQYGFTVSTGVITLENPADLSVSASVAGNDVTANGVGGTGTLEYSIDGSPFQTSNVFNDLANGTYTLTVRDANGCTSTTEVVVAINTVTATAVIQQGITCHGATDGVISATAGGGEAPYSYSLNGGTAQSSNVFSNLSAGTYTVVVTDNQGFSSTSAALVLSDPDPVSVSASVSLNSITVTASGGTGVLQYSLNGGTNQLSNVFNNLTNGIYTVVATDENGCTAATQVTVDVAPLSISATFTQNLDCFGDTDGTITANATGGIPPYEYKLNNGAYQSSNTFNGLGAGGYLVYVRDASGTEVTINAVISTPPQLLVSVSVSGNDAAATPSGGTSPYTYTTNAPSFDLQNLPNGTYGLTVTDAHGCTVSSTFTINVPPLLLSTTSTNVSCFGLANGSINLFASGGSAPYTYESQSFQNSVTISNLAAGSYTLTVTDANGTTQTTAVVITQPSLLELNAGVTGNDISAIATGGTTPYAYSLNGGPAQSDGTFNDLVPGSYTVVATDANGCTASVGNLTVTTNVVEPSIAWGLTVSPNPSNGLFTLTMLQAPEAIQAEVFDASGRLLRSYQFTAVNGQFVTTLDLRTLPSGNYLLRLNDGKQMGGVRLSKI